MPYANKERQLEYLRQHYQRNKRTYKVTACRNKGYYKSRNKTFIQRYKSLCGCSKCGYRKFPHVLEFHHHNDDKEHNIARMANHSYSLAAIKAEIRKCVVLCANCHREQHIS